jgi:hypothetical protein
MAEGGCAVKNLGGGVLHPPLRFETFQQTTWTVGCTPETLLQAIKGR